MNNFNLFLVGTVKGGTTWLYDVLAEHPDIYAPRLKEPHYFLERKTSRLFHDVVSSAEEYERLAGPGRSQMYRIDGSATNLSNPSIPKRIHTYNSEAKIVMLLRHPVRRAFSQYLMDCREGLIDSDFRTAVEADYDKGNNLADARMYLRMGLYFEVVRRYLELFSRERVLIGSYGKILTNKEALIAEVLSFLGLQPMEAMSLNVKQAKNVAALPANRIAKTILANDSIRLVAKHLIPERLRQVVKHSVLTKKTNLKLTDEECRAYYLKYFSDDSEKLFTLIGARLWNDTSDI